MQKFFFKAAGLFIFLFTTITALQVNAQGVNEKKEFSPFKTWRGVFTIQGGIEVPFVFEIAGTSRTNARVYFLNAEERFDGGTANWTADSLYINLEQFENELAFAIDPAGTLKGVLRKQNLSGNATPVQAAAYKNYRFPAPVKHTSTDISGTYAVELNSPAGAKEKAVALFSQEGNILKASFLRTTGDSRFLEGTIDNNQFYLSSFIGSAPSFYRGTITENGRLQGEIVGTRTNQSFSAIPDENAALPNPYTLTYLKQGYTSFDFSFPDTTGKPVTLKDDRFKNKVVIISITGSWCPNCYDEASLLASWYKTNKDRGVEIIALHYERQNDLVYAKKAMTRFRHKLGITYTQLFAGLADKQYVAASLPALNNFLSFPTTIFIDRNQKVRKIHTGYSGPATGKFYNQFLKEFNETTDALLKE